MEKYVVNVSPDFHGRFTNAKLQSATICLANNALKKPQVIVDLVEHAMDLTKMTTSKDAESDQQQQGRRVERKANQEAKRKESNLNLQEAICATMMHLICVVHAGMTLQ